MSSPPKNPAPPPSSATEVGALQVSFLQHLVPRGPVKTDKLTTLSDMVFEIANSRPLYDATMSVRQALARANQQGGAGRDDLTFQDRKKNMPAVLPSLALEPGTKVRGVDPKGRHSGLYGYDLDVPVGGTKKYGQRLTAEDIMRLQEALRSALGVAAFGVSVSGDGLWVFLLGPAANSVGEHKKHWSALRQQLPPGVVAVTDENSDNVNRARVLAYDPDCWMAETVTPLEGAGGDFEDKHDDETAEFNDLDWLPVPQLYNDWLSWVVTLKTCGFTAVEVENWSTAGSKYRVGEVLTRWDHLTAGNSAQEWQRFLKAAPPGVGVSSDFKLPWLKHVSGQKVVVTNSSIVNVEIALNALGFEGAWRYEGWHKRAEWCLDGLNWDLSN